MYIFPTRTTLQEYKYRIHNTQIYVLFAVNFFLLLSRFSSVFLPPTGSPVIMSVMLFYFFIVRSKINYKYEELNTVVWLLMNTIYAPASPNAGERHQLLVPSFWNNQQYEMSTVPFSTAEFITHLQVNLSNSFFNSTTFQKNFTRKYINMRWPQQKTLGFVSSSQRSPYNSLSNT